MTKSVTKNPKLTGKVMVVLPTLGDRIELLKETFQSLSIQDSQILDIVVVCPKKSVEARKLAVKFGAVLVDDPGGLSAALNEGFKLLQPNHQYACWLGDDDLLSPNSLSVTVPLMDANPSAVIIFGHCDYIDDAGKLIFTNKANRLAPWLMSWGPNLVPLMGMLYRVDALKKAGEFNPDNKYSMDLDMLLRMKKMGKFINTDQVLGSFRWHPSSTTVANRTKSLNEAKLVKRNYLPRILKPFAPLWELPVGVATQIAAKRVSKMAKS